MNGVRRQLGHRSAFEHILPSRTLRRSSYGRMRDPAENKDIVMSMGFSGERSDEEAWPAFNSLLLTIKEISDSMRVLSLTREVPEAPETFGCCWAPPRMCEQYGDVHRGACLVFRRRQAQNRDPRAETGANHPEQPTLFMRAVRYTAAGIANSSLIGSAAQTPPDACPWPQRKRSAAPKISPRPSAGSRALRERAHCRR